MLSITSRTLLGLIIGTSCLFSIAEAKPVRDAEARAEMMQLRAQKATINAQERMLKLKTALELRENQQSAWNDYEAYMLNELSQKKSMMADVRERRMGKQAPPSSLELAQANVVRLEQQLNNAKQRLVVFADLYNVLDEEQRQTVDRLTHKKVKRMAKELRKRKRQ